VDVNAVGPPVTFTGANTTSGIFQTLTTLKLNLQAGSAADVRLRLDDLDTDLNTVLNQQTSLGSVRNRLEKTQINLEDREIFLSEQYANIQDVNLPELITELTAAENTYQMTLASTARVIQPSLMQFLN
jgi:flagellar hook-associated protein 3 FlgL